MAEREDRAPSERHLALRRHVTLLFSDLSDSTTLAGSIEPEHYNDVLDHMRHCANTILPKYGAILVDIRGDGFLAMFGFPDASEYDGRRAAEAALELHEAIAPSPIPLPAPLPPTLSLHSGIHSGLVLVIEGDPMARYLLVGEAPSIAARLSDAALRNEILVSATTLGTEAHFFQLRDRHDLKLQGKSDPVATVQVLGRAPVATRFEARVQHGLTPFEDRIEEMATLERMLESAVAGRLQLVSIVGAAGLGKTRLAEEFLSRARARGCAVHRGYCEEHSAEPLQPFRQMLRAMDAAVPATAAGAGLRQWFASLAASGPRVLFIDDWQWADDATRTALAEIRSQVNARVLILTTSRVTDQSVDVSSHDTRILLSRLDDDAARRTIRTLRPAADPFVIDRVRELSGGNPLFIEELCHSRDLGGAIERSAGSHAWLSTLIESRVAHLPVEQAQVARTAAVVGLVVPAWLLRQITGYAEDHPVIRDLAERDLIFPGEAAGTLRFKHGITRDVIYESLGLRWREGMHLQIARSLEAHNLGEPTNDHLEALAYHYRAAGQRDKAADYAERAGDKARAAAALDRARTHYAAALDLITPDTQASYDRWIAIAQRFGLACVFDPARAHLPMLQRAVDLARARNDHAALAVTRYWLGYVTYALGDLGFGILNLEQALAASAEAAAALGPDHSPSLAIKVEAHRVQVLATLGQAHAAAGEYDRALAHLEAAIAIRREHRGDSGPGVGSAYTFACRGAVLGDLGRFDEAHAAFDYALDAVREGNHPVKGSILGLRGAVFAWQQQWADALSCATEAQQIGARVESLYVLAISQTLLGFARWRLERTPDAIDTILRAVSWLESRGKRLFISMSYGWLAEAMLETGRYDEARTHAAHAIRRARQRDPFGEAAAYRVLAQMPERYRRHSPEFYLTRALDSARRRQSPHETALTLKLLPPLPGRRRLASIHAPVTGHGS